MNKNLRIEELLKVKEMTLTDLARKINLKEGKKMGDKNDKRILFNLAQS